MSGQEREVTAAAEALFKASPDAVCSATLTESPERAVYIDAARAALNAALAVREEPPTAQNGDPCDCQTPGDWHRVASDFQRAMFDERARADRAEALIAELEAAAREDSERCL